MQGSKIDFLNLNKGHFLGIQYCYKIQELKADIMTNPLICSKLMGVKTDLVQNCAWHMGVLDLSERGRVELQFVHTGGSGVVPARALAVQLSLGVRVHLAQLQLRVPRLGERLSMINKNTNSFLTQGCDSSS